VSREKNTSLKGHFLPMCVNIVCILALLGYLWLQYQWLINTLDLVLTVLSLFGAIKMVLKFIEPNIGAVILGFIYIYNDVCVAPETNQHTHSMTLNEMATVH